MPVEPWRNWYHCIVGTYGQWLPGDERGWRERNHHEHVHGYYNPPAQPTRLSEARLANSRRIMNWHPYLIESADRSTIGGHLLESFKLQNIPILALAVCAKNFHALLQIAQQNPKRILGIAKRHVTIRFAPLINSSTNKRLQIWEGGGHGKAIRDRRHALEALQYILYHLHEGAWVWSYHDDPQYAIQSARAVEDGGLNPIAHRSRA